MFCPQCGNPVPDHVKFCTKCGSRLPVRSANTPPSQYPTQPAQQEINPPPETYSAPETYSEAHSAPRKSNKALIAVIISILVVVIAASVVGILVIRGIIFSGSSDNETLSGAASAETASADAPAEAATTEEAPAPSEALAPSPSPTPTPSPSPSPSPTPEPIPTDFAGMLSYAAGISDTTTMSLVTTDVSDYPNVRAYYSVVDSAGEAVILQSPTAGIVERIESGAEIERTVRSVERLEGNEGIGIDILVDKSSSMSGDMAQMQTILQDFINSLDYASGDKAEIISFDSYIMYMCNYTDNRDNLLGGISNMTPYGNTALYDALMEGVTNAGYRTGANCVIGFTDGGDNESVYTYGEVIYAAQQKEIPIYLIGTGGANSSVLQQIADETGGRYWNINSISGMDEVLKEIYSVQKNMYCVEYESDPDADPYASRTVSCVILSEDRAAVAENETFTASQVIQQTTHDVRYEAVKADVSWQEANDLAVSKGGHLVTITSQQEMDTVTALAEQYGIKYCWIGGYTSVRDNTAFGHWTTGENFEQYTAWFPGEPSRNDKDGTPEFYIMLWYVQDAWSWNDQRNDVIRDTNLTYFIGNTGYIIEYEN